MGTKKEDITVELKDGRIIYLPPGDTARIAPAVICQVANRIAVLRQFLPTFPEEVQRVLRFLALPLPFEEEFCSGKIERIHDAILKMDVGYRVKEDS